MNAPRTHITYIPVTSSTPIYHAIQLDGADRVQAKGYFFHDMRQPAPQCLVGPYPSVLAAASAGQRRLDSVEQGDAPFVGD